MEETRSKLVEIGNEILDENLSIKGDEWLKKIIERWNFEGFRTKFIFQDIGIGKTTLREWRNKEKKPSIDNLKKLSDYFHIELSLLRDMFDIPVNICPVTEVDFQKHFGHMLRDMFFNNTTKSYSRIALQLDITPETIKSWISGNTIPSDKSLEKLTQFGLIFNPEKRYNYIEKFFNSLSNNKDIKQSFENFEPTAKYDNWSYWKVSFLNTKRIPLKRFLYIINYRKLSVEKAISIWLGSGEEQYTISGIFVPTEPIEKDIDESWKEVFGNASVEDIVNGKKKVEQKTPFITEIENTNVADNIVAETETTDKDIRSIDYLYNENFHKLCQSFGLEKPDYLADYKKNHKITDKDFEELQMREIYMSYDTARQLYVLLQDKNLYEQNLIRLVLDNAIQHILTNFSDSKLFKNKEKEI